MCPFFMSNSTAGENGWEGAWNKSRTNKAVTLKRKLPCLSDRFLFSRHDPSYEGVQGVGSCPYRPSSCKAALGVHCGLWRAKGCPPTYPIRLHAVALPDQGLSRSVCVLRKNLPKSHFQLAWITPTFQHLPQSWPTWVPQLCANQHYFSSFVFAFFFPKDCKSLSTDSHHHLDTLPLEIHEKFLWRSWHQ